MICLLQNRYSNLYMFELEFPLDTLEIINETSLCVSGVQSYSKTCELLQLCVPPKLLQHESEEGLCKDRDFKILSGGYADGRIRQVKFITSSTNLVATYQDGFSGVIVYEVGDDNRATIVEKCRLPTSNPAVAKGKSLCVMNDKILLGTTLKETSSIDQHLGICLTEWKMDDKCNTPSLANTRYIWKTFSEFDPGHIIKMKQWEQDTCIFLTSRGTLALYDLRTGSGAPDIFFHATKSPNIVSHDPLFSPPDSIIFSFDCMAQRNQIGVLDSCGGYENFDARFVGKKEACHESTAEAGTTTTRCTRSRSLLSEFSGLAGVYPDSFNIEYESERTKVRENERIRFIISGLKKECVPVLEENIENTADDVDFINSVFSHDGHSKPVTHATWHPASTNLIFSASIDAVLHAWQYIPEKEN